MTVIAPARSPRRSPTRSPARSPAKKRVSEMKPSAERENIVKNNNNIKGSRQLWTGEKRALEITEKIEIVEKIKKVEIIEEIEKDLLSDRENMAVIEIRDNRLIDKE